MKFKTNCVILLIRRLGNLSRNFFAEKIYICFLASFILMTPVFADEVSTQAQNSEQAAAARHVGIRGHQRKKVAVKQRRSGHFDFRWRSAELAVRGRGISVGAENRFAECQLTGRPGKPDFALCDPPVRRQNPG